MRIKVAALLLCVWIPLTSCKSDPVAVLNSVVTAAEAVLPLIANLSPGDQGRIKAYLDSVMAITQDVINSGTTADKLAAAVNDFARLDVPVLSTNASPGAVAALNGVVAAVQRFLKSYQGTPQVPILKPNQIQKAQQVKAKAIEIRGRIRG